MTQDEKIDLILKTQATMLKMITNLGTAIAKYHVAGVPSDDIESMMGDGDVHIQDATEINEAAVAVALAGKLSVAPELNKGLAHEDRLIECKGCGMLWQQKDVESWGELRPVADVAHGGELVGCANCDNRLMLKLTAERVLSPSGGKP